MFDTGSMIIAGVMMLVSWLVSNRLQSKFDHYSKVHLRNGMSGAEIAEKIIANDSQSLKFKKKLIQLAISNIGYLKSLLHSNHFAAHMQFSHSQYNQATLHSV